MTGLGLRAALLRYVLSSVSSLKRAYRSSLEASFAPAPVPPYLRQHEAQARVLGYLMGLEAWHEVAFGGVRGARADRWLVACAAMTYDDAVDREGFREWDLLERFLSGGSDSLEGGSGGGATAAIMPCLSRLAASASLPGPEATQCMVAINRATRASFEASSSTASEAARLRRVTYDKGGSSFRLLTLIGGREEAAELDAVALEFGAASQIADDIYDVEEDRRCGQRTLASWRLLDEPDRRLLEGVTERLPRQSGKVPLLLAHAWRIHLRDALRLYDSGGAGRAWRYDLGQSAFRVGMRLLPGGA